MGSERVYQQWQSLWLRIQNKPVTMPMPLGARTCSPAHLLCGCGDSSSESALQQQLPAWREASDLYQIPPKAWEGFRRHLHSGRLLKNRWKTTCAAVNILLCITAEHPETLSHNLPNKYGAGTNICPAFFNLIQHNRRLGSFPALLYVNNSKICILDFNPRICGQDMIKLLETASINRFQVSLMFWVNWNRTAMSSSSGPRQELF